MLTASLLLLFKFAQVFYSTTAYALYPYGTDVGDQLSPAEDDSCAVRYDLGLQVFSKAYNTVYVSVCMTRNVTPLFYKSLPLLGREAVL